MNKTTIVVLLLVALLLGGIGYVYYAGDNGGMNPSPTPTTMSDSGSMNDDNMVSPSPSPSPSGMSDENMIVYKEMIKVSSPSENETVSSPLTVKGEAKGTWYSEGVFNVVLEDSEGNEIASKNAEAQDDWMTEDYVPFTVTIGFTDPSTTEGTLILEKSNPSGLQANADQLEIPVSFN